MPIDEITVEYDIEVSREEISIGGFVAMAIMAKVSSEKIRVFSSEGEVFHVRK